ncbi:MAG: hypothetical protein LBV34_10990 [Nocardiopsaceae bacterium]|jgi:hypothetical protein|nr:hypothetical protein [Nocardiopsaceae bacterium]
MAFNRAFALRAATHIAVWLPFLYGAISAMQDNWRPISDKASIAIRSWDVLTSYGPLLGQPSRLARGLYDPGPIQYWLLSVPVHIDPKTGALWGAALWCMVACSLTIEAASSAAGVAGGLLASATLLGAVLWMPSITRQPLWNPWFGMMFFLAALAAAWAAMSGRRRWWPVLIVTASIAAQAHLMYAIASSSLVLAALVVGLVGTIGARGGVASYRWLIIGVAAGLFCWSAPLIQQFTARNGNISALLRNSSGGPGSTGGLTFGLQAVAASIQPVPVWWTPFSNIRSLSLAATWPVASGVTALVIIVAVLIAAFGPLRSRRTAAIAGVSLLISVAALATYSSVPAENISESSTTFNNLTYLMAPMYAVGVAAWITVISGVVLVARRFARRAATVPAAEQAAAPAIVPATGAASSGPPPASVTGNAGQPGTPYRATRLVRAKWAQPVASGLAIVVIGTASGLATNQAQARQTMIERSVTYAVRVASQKVQAKLRRQPVALVILGRNRHYRRQLTFGLACALETMGYAPRVEQKYAWELGTVFTYGGQRMAAVIVHMHRSRPLRVTIQRHTVSATTTGSS